MSICGFRFRRRVVVRLSADWGWCSHARGVDSAAERSLGWSTLETAEEVVGKYSPMLLSGYASSITSSSYDEEHLSV